MITQVDIHASQGTILHLPIDAVTGILVEEISGLDPVKATLVTSSFALQDGTQYYSSRRESRNIVLQLGFEPDWEVGETVRALRRAVYSTLMPKTAVELHFFLDDGTEMFILGRVESCETPMFTQEPVVNVSVMCFDPDFKSPTNTIFPGSSTAGSTPTSIVYDGTVETGLVFSLLVDRSMSGFSLYHQAPDGSNSSLVFESALLSGDVVTISTISGNKYVTRTRAGVTSSILYGVAPASNWIELAPGTNSLRVYADGAAVPYNLVYTKRFGALA